MTNRIVRPVRKSTMAQSSNPISVLVTRIRETLFVTCAGVLVVSCGRGEVEEPSVGAAGSGREADVPALRTWTTQSPPASAAVREAGVDKPQPAGVRDDGMEDEEGAEVIPTDPAELSAIVREVDALARGDKRAAGRRAARALRGLSVADPEWEVVADEDGSLYLGADHVPMLRALAEHVFEADATYGEGLSEMIPEELRASIVGEKVSAEVSEGKTEEVGEWIRGLEDRELASVARWELVRTLYERDGMPEAFDNYPAVLKARINDVMEAGQWFSVLEARNSGTR